MSARLTPDEFREIAPDEYARLYGTPTPSPPKQDAPTPRPPPKRKPRERQEGSDGFVAFFLALLLALAQFAICIYVLTHY